MKGKRTSSKKWKRCFNDENKKEIQTLAKQIAFTIKQEKDLRSILLTDITNKQ